MSCVKFGTGRVAIVAKPGSRWLKGNERYPGKKGTVGHAQPEGWARGARTTKGKKLDEAAREKRQEEK